MLGEIGKLQLPVLPAVRAHQLCDPLHVPRRSASLQLRVHEGVRAFVQEQVTSIVRAGLLVHPQLVATLISVEKRRKIIRQQACALKPLFAIHEVASHLPGGHFVGRHAKVLTPGNHGRIKHLRQFVDLRPRRDIGIERQMHSFEFADSRNLQPLEINRLRQGRGEGRHRRIVDRRDTLVGRQRVRHRT